MKPIKILLFVLIFSYSENIKAQDTFYISGKVVSSVNGVPLPEGVVRIVNSTKGVLTDFVGNFILKELKNGIYKLKISYISYDEKEIEIVIANNSVSGLNIVLNTNCLIDDAIAQYDIGYNIPKLYLIGSIAPVTFDDDSLFEKRYNIEYYDFGCTPPAYECVYEYNIKVFEFLDNKFGKIWREDVRDDVIGFYSYITNQ